MEEEERDDGLSPWNKSFEGSVDGRFSGTLSISSDSFASRAHILHKISQWMSNHQIAQHRIHHTLPASDEIRSIIQDLGRPTSIPEGVIPALCECLRPCQLMWTGMEDSDQECRIWVCAEYNCFFSQALQSDLDGMAHSYNVVKWDLEGSLGNMVVDGHYGLDRYVMLSDMLGWWGDSFSNGFIVNLKKQYESARANTWSDSVVVYPQGSLPMAPGQEYDAFCSYRWQTGRSSLHLAFCSVFAMPIVMLMMICVYPILAIIFYFAVTKNIPLDNNKVAPLGFKPYSSGDHIWYWYWFRIVGSFVIILILAFGAHVAYVKRVFYTFFDSKKLKKALNDYIGCFLCLQAISEEMVFG